MAGGYFVSQNKVIPGAYINFSSEAQKNSTPSNRGVVTMPLPIKFGPVKTFVLVNSKSDFIDLIGYDINDPELLLIKETLKRANALLLYRISDGTKANSTSNGLTCTAKYPGTRGNAITISITEYVDIENSFIVKTFLSGIQMDEQIAATIGDLQNNNLVDFSGTDDTVLVATSGIILENGTDIAPISSDYTTYFNSLEIHEFNTLALPITDSTIKATATNFIKRMIEQEGKKIQLVLSEYSEADHEGIISVENGVILKDNTIIDKVKAVAWVAGATAAANINKDLTYDEYEDAVDVDTRYTNSQIENMIAEGKFFFVPKSFNGLTKIVIQEDINTFKTITNTKGKEFHWNRTVRVMFDIATTISRIWEERYIGKVDASDDGLNCFKGDIINYFESLQKQNAIKNFNSDNDINISFNENNAVANVGIQVVKSLKKLYMSVVLK